MKRLLLTMALTTIGLAAFPAINMARHANAARTPGIPSEKTQKSGFLRNPSLLTREGMKPAEGIEAGIINEAPDGKQVMMLGSSETFYIYYDEISMDESYGIAYETVWTEDGDVYLKSPISMLDWTSYIKGHETEDGIVFDFPQPVFETEADNEKYVFYVDVLEGKEVESPYGGSTTTFIPAENTRSITFRKMEDGSFRMEGENMLGVTYNDEWQGYGEMNMSLLPFEATPVVEPEGIKYDYSYVLVDEFNGWFEPILRPIGIGEADGTTYISGIASGLPDAVITGTFDKENNTLTIPSEQFLGKFYNHYIFMMVGAGYTYWDDEWEEEMFSFDAVKEPMVLDFDPETNVFRPRILEGNDQAYLIFNFGNTETYPCEYYAVDRIYSQGEITDYAPIAPQIQYVDDISYLDPDYSYSVNFEIFGDNSEGQLLRESNIYYNIFINGELYTFTSEEYPSLLTEGVTELTDIPVFFNAGDDIYAYGTSHGVALKRQDVETIGVRTVYIDGDLRAESETVTVNKYGEPVSVDTVIDGGKTSTEYFDLTGRRINGAVKGSVVIRRTTLGDGSIRTEKVVK